jgi:predicted  nucleic acid-binding Zn-ribbon protein
MADLDKMVELQERYQKAKENHIRLKTQLDSLEARKAQVVETIKAEGVEPEQLDEKIVELEAQIESESKNIEGLLAKVGY